MDIVVTVKQVPDPDIPPTHFKVDEAAKKVIPPAGVSPVMNGYDAHALEAALRLKEQLLLMEGTQNAVTAEGLFLKALDWARRQGARSWELRAATSLARLWHQQGKLNEARQVLGDVYGWFTEGFDTADLQEAKALLEALT